MGRRPSGTSYTAPGLVAALIVLMPWQMHAVVNLERHSPHLAGVQLQFSVVGVVDLIALTLVAVALAGGAWRALRSSMALLGLAAIGLVMTVWLIADPGWETAMRTLRTAGLVGAGCIVATTSRDDFRRFVVWPFAASAALQSTIALAQTFIGPWPTEPRLQGGWSPGVGTYLHQYSFAAYVLVAIAVVLGYLALGNRRSIPLTGALAVMGAGIGVVFGRSALLGLLLIGAVYTIHFLRARALHSLVPLVSLGLGFAATSAITASGWLSRVSSTDEGRISLMERAIDIITANPWLGVGPGGYGPTVAQWSTPPDQYIVHSVPILAIAEFGILIGVAFTVWLGVLGLQSIRSSIAAVGVYVVAVPFLLFDNLHYVKSAGWALFGMWIAVIAYWTRNDPPNDETEENGMSAQGDARTTTPAEAPT